MEKMEFIDVLFALRNHKKMKLSSWDDINYIEMNSDGKVVMITRSPTGGRVCTKYNYSAWKLQEVADWEEWKEPVKKYNFAQAMELVLQGKKVKLLSSVGNYFIFADLNPASNSYGKLMICRNSCPVQEWNMFTYHVTATDWVEVE